MGFWRDPARKDWVYRFQHRGKNHGGRGYNTKAEARAAREEHRKRLKDDAQTPAIIVTGFKQVAYEYLDDSKRRHANKTYKGKAYVYKLFLKHLGADKPINQITPHDIHSFLITRPSNYNFNVHRKELYALFTYARRQGLVTYNPCIDVDPMPHTAARKVIPTEQQVLKLIMVADPETEQPLFLTVLHLLGRIDEALRMTWQDVNFETRVVTLWTRKRKGGSYEADYMPMNQDLYDVLWPLWKSRAQNTWVFFNEKTGTRYMKRPKMMRGLCKRAGIDPHFGFHAIRHFMASWLSDKEKRSTKSIQKLLRHKAQRTTEIYLHSVDESQRSAMESIEGKFSKTMVSGNGVGSDEKQPKIADTSANGGK